MARHHRSATFRQFGLFVVALAAAAFTFTARASAQEFTLKFDTQTINDIQHEYMKVFKTELEKASNGKIKVEVYPASQLGNFQRMMEGIRLGTIEAIIAPAESYVAVDPRYQAIASRLVKEIAMLGGDVRAFTSHYVADLLVKRCKELG